MRDTPTTQDPAPRTLADPRSLPAGFHGAVSEFKRHLIEATLTRLGGNRTQAARALGLQRTYLLRLIRVFGVSVPRRGRAMTLPAHGPRAGAGESARGGSAANGVDTRRRAV